MLYILKTTEFLFRMVRYGILVCLLLALIGFALPYIHNMDQFHYMHYILLFNEKAAALIKAYVPVEVGGFNITQYLLVFFIFILISVSNVIIRRLDMWADLAQHKNETKPLKIRNESNND